MLIYFDMSEDKNPYYIEQYTVEVRKLKENDQLVSVEWREASAPYGMNYSPIGPSLTTFDEKTGAKEYEVYTDEYGRKTRDLTFNLKTGKIKKEVFHPHSEDDCSNKVEPI